MGEVYRALDLKLRRDVAIKVLPAAVSNDPERVQRLEREARLLASLNHPHIGAIYGFEEHAGVYGLVLELVEGETLAERLAAGPLPVAETLALARQIIDALDAAHERGIIHRDLKPANVKVTPEGIVKVLDFGLAKAVVDEAPAAELTHSPTITIERTRSGTILGTAAYMSPEQARGKTVDKRTDIWAFGCVLYELITGRRAFHGETTSDTIAAILGREPDWTLLPANTPTGLRRLLERCLEKDIRRRLRDIGDARVELESTIETGATPSATLLPHRTKVPWRAVALLSIGLILISVAILTWRIGFQRTAQTPEWSTAQAVATQLTNYGGTEASGAISPDGRSFVFVSDQGGTPDIWLRQVSGGEPVRLTNDAAEEADLAYAPDGESIYFTRIEQGGSSIWRIGFLGGQARKVQSGAQTPAPSPDGRNIAYSYIDSERGFDLALAVSALDGSGKRTLARGIAGGVFGTRPAWSPDGRRVAYSQGGLFTSFNLFVVDAISGETRQVTRFLRSNQGVQGRVGLPDNRHLVVSYVPISRQQSPSDLGILDVEDGSISRLTMTTADSFGALSLSADGSRLLATAIQTQRELWKVPAGPDPDANGRGAVRVLDNTQSPMWTFVSRDGRTVLFSNALVGSRNLWTMPFDQSARARQITAISGEAVSHSSLSPDGARVAFASSATGNSDIWVQNLDGSDLRQLSNDEAADAWPVWSPDGRLIVFASLRGGSWETKIVPASGGPAEKLMDGFFRGDWIPQPAGSGTWIVTSVAGSGGLRLLDVEKRAVLWEERRAGSGLSLPMFSPDGKLISIPLQEKRDRDAIWLFETATGKSRLAVRFPEPFRIFFRASWVDNGKAFVVNRYRNISHMVLFDHFWVGNTTRR